MKHLPSVTIGIVAYNEEKNIKKLLMSLPGLNYSNIKLEEIIVISDGSTDRTTSRISEVKNSLIRQISHFDRKGKGNRLDEICDRTNSNILILLDADIIINDHEFIHKLIEPIICSAVNLTSCFVEELPAKTYIGTMLTESMRFKKKLFASLNDGDTLYTCHGRARAITKSLYKKLDFSHYIADDAYSYLFAKKHGYKYGYVSSTSVLYKIPETLSDHLKQSVRFYSSQKEFRKEFGMKYVDNAYAIPSSSLFMHIVSSFLQSPSQIIAYLIITLVSIASSRHSHVKWGTAYSTK